MRNMKASAAIASIGLILTVGASGAGAYDNTGAVAKRRVVVNGVDCPSAVVDNCPEVKLLLDEAIEMFRQDEAVILIRLPESTLPSVSQTTTTLAGAAAALEYLVAAGVPRQQVAIDCSRTRSIEQATAASPHDLLCLAQSPGRGPLTR